MLLRNYLFHFFVILLPLIIFRLPLIVITLLLIQLIQLEKLTFKLILTRK
jgi:hypothetical protein